MQRNSIQRTLVRGANCKQPVAGVSTYLPISPTGGQAGVQRKAVFERLSGAEVRCRLESGPSMLWAGSRSTTFDCRERPVPGCGLVRVRRDSANVLRLLFAVLAYQRRGELIAIGYCLPTNRFALTHGRGSDSSTRNQPRRRHQAMASPSRKPRAMFSRAMQAAVVKSMAKASVRDV